jgi:hypothetical protein
MDVLKWKAKGVFRSEVIVLQDRLLVGMLRRTAWGTSAYGEIRGRMVRFERKNLFSSRVLIKDIEGVKERGWVKLNALKGRAEIVIDGQRYTWERKDRAGRCTCIVSEEGEKVTLTTDRGTDRSGTLQFGYIDPTLFLVGIYLSGIQRRLFRLWRV